MSVKSLAMMEVGLQQELVEAAEDPPRSKAH
jgi:hypothetical protein